MLFFRTLINNITFQTIKGNLYILLLNIILIATPIIFLAYQIGLIIKHVTYYVSLKKVFDKSFFK